MRNKILVFTLAFFTWVLLGSTNPTYCFAQTPKNLVRDFYTWYLGELNKFDKLPESSNDIYKYIYPCVVSKLRIEYKMGARSFNYFIQSNDYWPELSLHITTGEAVKINDSVSIVPLGFGETKERSVPRLIVFVQNEKGTLYITKVEEADTPY